MCVSKAVVLALALCVSATTVAAKASDCMIKDVSDVMSGKEGAVIPDSCEKLFLVASVVTVDGAERLANSLATHLYIKELWLYDNQLGDEATGHIASVFRTNNVIEALYLQKNNVGAQGAVQLAEAIKFNKKSSLKLLWISYNKIGDEGAIALIDAIGTHGSDDNENHWIAKIKDLDLRGNEIGTAGARAVYDMVKCNTRLEKVQMDGPKKFLDDLEMLVKSNSNAELAQAKIAMCKEAEEVRMKIARGEITAEEAEAEATAKKERVEAEQKARNEADAAAQVERGQRVLSDMACDAISREGCNEKQTKFIAKIAEKFAGDQGKLEGERSRLQKQVGSKMKPSLAAWMSTRISILNQLITAAKDSAAMPPAAKDEL